MKEPIVPIDQRWKIICPSYTGTFKKAVAIVNEVISEDVHYIPEVLTSCDDKNSHLVIIAAPDNPLVSSLLGEKPTENGYIVKVFDNPYAEGRKIAVVGRYADKINVGDHGSSNVYSPYTVTAFKGIRNRFGDNCKVYNGCDTKLAVETAKDCEYIVVCVGSDYKQEGEFLVNLGNIKQKPVGKGGDRISLRVPDEDVALIRALAKTGKKLIVNVMGGSAYVIREWADCADAILFSFYSGLEGGNALADVLSGDVNPGGKLPFTVACDEKDYPSFLHIEDSQRTIDYGYYHGYTLLDKKGTAPQYPFGFGLSYTDFKIENPKAVLKENSIEVSADIKNIGAVDGDEVLQVYVSSENTEKDRPVKLLKGFSRVTVKAGESVSAIVAVNIDDIRFYNPDNGEWELDKSYAVLAGTNSGNAEVIGKIEF